MTFVFGSLWARRRAQGSGAQARPYRWLSRGLGLAALGVALFALWSTMADHRRTRAARPAGTPTARP
jgi:hypothetical protein